MIRSLYTVLLAAILSAGAIATPAKAANDANLYAHIFGANLGFGAGGLPGEFLVFRAWTSTPQVPYEASTVIKHSGALWVALTAPGASDEPGVAAVWEKITDQTGGGGTGDITGVATAANSAGWRVARTRGRRGFRRSTSPTIGRDRGTLPAAIILGVR